MSRGHWEEDNELPFTVYRFCNDDGIHLFSMTENQDGDGEPTWSLTYSDGGYKDIGYWSLDEAKHQALLFMYGKLCDDMRNYQEWIDTIISMESEDE